jgi:hypothetical protein
MDGRHSELTSFHQSLSLEPTRPLSAREQFHWDRIINSFPAASFCDADMILLTSLVKAIVRLEEAEEADPPLTSAVIHRYFNTVNHMMRALRLHRNERNTKPNGTSGDGADPNTAIHDVAQMKTISYKSPWAQDN